MKILILRGILSFHRYFRGNLGRPFMKSSYIVLIENFPVVESFHTNRSGSSFSCTVINLWHKCNHSVHLLPVRVLRNLIGKGIWNITEATLTSFRSTILYNKGYCLANGTLPNQISSQNLVCSPSPITKDPCLKKLSLTCIRLFQKGESVGFASTRDRVLLERYLLCRMSCHTPSL